MLTSFVKSTPLDLRKRQDTSTDFKKCNGEYAIHLTSMDYSPNPIVTGQNITVHMVGETAEVIEKGAIMKIYHDHKGKFEHELDYCKLFVEPSGFVCPVEKGHLDFTATWLIGKHPSEPNKIVSPLYTRVS
ncbi:19305_t:CDS:1, partial [Funneliformis geosporum]